jgi:hypothetical protein
MKTGGLKRFLLAGALLPALAAAQPAIEVRFTDPTRFTDLRYTTSDDAHDAADLADELRRYLERRAPVYVPAGKRLAVVITDVDMAGELRPSAGGSVYMLRRMIRGIYPPRVDLEFRLVAADGTVEREGRRELRNNAFLYGKYAHQRAPLVHEKALLERWLLAEFPSPR